MSRFKRRIRRGLIPGAGRRRGYTRGSGGTPKVIMVPVCLEELYRTDGTTANLKGRVTMAWSALGRTWSTPVEILAPLTGPQTGTIGVWYNDDANFGPLLRFAIEVCNAAGTALTGC